MAHFAEAMTPDDVPDWHKGEAMETDRHVHVCACGERWECSKSDCHTADICQRCEDEELTTYLDARQPTLEPIEALLSARRSGQ